MGIFPLLLVAAVNQLWWGRCKGTCVNIRMRQSQCCEIEDPGSSPHGVMKLRGWPLNSHSPSAWLTSQGYCEDNVGRQSCEPCWRKSGVQILILKVTRGWYLIQSCYFEHQHPVAELEVNGTEKAYWSTRIFYHMFGMGFSCFLTIHYANNGEPLTFLTLMFCIATYAVNLLLVILGLASVVAALTFTLSRYVGSA